MVTDLMSPTPTTVLPNPMGSSPTTSNGGTQSPTFATANATQAFLHEEVTSGEMFIYVFIPIGAVVLALLLTALVIFMLKKSKLDKLRHHLMPLYNFDPAEEGEDWETELLEEGMDHRVGPRVKSPGLIDEPKLAFQGDSGL